MIDEGRVRTQCNKRTNEIRRFFRWCVEEQIVSPLILESLRAVAPLMPGRSGVKESEPRRPADPDAVEKVLPFLPPAPAAMVKLLRLTGARPSEIITLVSARFWAWKNPDDPVLVKSARDLDFEFTELVHRKRELERRGRR
jgi:hypothetical protein